MYTIIVLNVRKHDYGHILIKELYKFSQTV